MQQQHAQETVVEARLQRYLDDLQEPMTTLGEVATQEWRTEAEAHLRSMIAAYEELGETPEEATRLALERFGAPKRIGHRLQSITRSNKARHNPELKLVNCIFGCYASYLAPALVAFFAFIFLYTYTDNRIALTVTRNLMGTFLLLGPFLAGWVLGGRLPWIREEIRRIAATYGPQRITRLRFYLAITVVFTSLELGLMWSLLRTFSEGTLPVILMTPDFLPILACTPIMLSVAYWRERYLLPTKTQHGVAE